MEDAKFLEIILKEIVTKPEEINVESKTDKIGVLLTVKCNKEDAGILVGREGRMAQAIKTIMKGFGKKNQARISVRLDIPEVRRNE